MMNKVKTPSSVVDLACVSFDILASDTQFALFFISQSQPPHWLIITGTDLEEEGGVIEAFHPRSNLTASFLFIPFGTYTLSQHARLTAFKAAKVVDLQGSLR